MLQQSSHIPPPTTIMGIYCNITGRAGNTGMATSFYVPGYDPKVGSGAIAKDLLHLLRESKQDIPDWFLMLPEVSSAAAGGHRKGKCCFNHVTNFVSILSQTCFQSWHKYYLNYIINAVSILSRTFFQPWHKRCFNHIINAVSIMSQMLF